MSVADARVADDVQQRLVSLELLDLSAHAVGDIARRRLLGERLAELVQRPAHVSQLLLDRLGVQRLERTCSSYPAAGPICNISRDYLTTMPYYILLAHCCLSCRGVAKGGLMGPGTPQSNPTENY